MDRGLKPAFHELSAIGYEPLMCKLGRMPRVLKMESCAVVRLAACNDKLIISGGECTMSLERHTCPSHHLQLLVQGCDLLLSRRLVLVLQIVSGQNRTYVHTLVAFHLKRVQGAPGLEDSGQRCLYCVSLIHFQKGASTGRTKVG